MGKEEERDFGGEESTKNWMKVPNFTENKDFTFSYNDFQTDKIM